MMTNSEIVDILNDITWNGCGRYEKEIMIECRAKAISALQENTKLKAEIEQLKSELEQSVRFKKYFMELYNQGLEVSNWHLNGELEPLTNFIDSALEEAEQSLKGQV